MLVLSNGNRVVVEWVQHELLEEPIHVYNFEVEDFHTYFVGECGVLVHNDCTFEGNYVIQNDELIDPQRKDKKGRTNVERMKKGLAPIGNDGKPVNLHHMDQTQSGQILEISASEHQKRYSELHQNTGQSPSKIDRKVFSKWRRHYWKHRAKSFLLEQEI